MNQSTEKDAYRFLSKYLKNAEIEHFPKESLFRHQGRIDICGLECTLILQSRYDFEVVEAFLYLPFSFDESHEDDVVTIINFINGYIFRGHYEFNGEMIRYRVVVPVHCIKPSAWVCEYMISTFYGPNLDLAVAAFQEILESETLIDDVANNYYDRVIQVTEPQNNMNVSLH